MDSKTIFSILGVIGFIVLIGVGHNFATKYNKRKRYEAKVKAGFIKEGEEIVPETPEQKKAKMDAALKLYADMNKDKTDKK